jgi:acetylornithine deacetylase
MTDSKGILDQLVQFESVSRNSNLELISFIREFLSRHGVAVKLVHDESGTKANLFATIGSADVPGVMLSGHTDVVPVDGQNWSHPAFRLTTQDGLLFGRGTADMKGFIACCLSLVGRMDAGRLKTPIHLAFSYDEEVGCIGVRRLIDMLNEFGPKARFCIVGEPTSMQVATAHKGKIAARAVFHGVEAHSSLAPQGLNAIHLACDFVGRLRSRQAHFATQGQQDTDYDVAYTTLHAGLISGGVALNIVPRDASVDFEIRHLPGDDPDKIIADLRADAADILRSYRDPFPQSAIEINVLNAYPGLDTPVSSEIVGFVKKLTGANATTKIAFGTEGGLFNKHMGLPVVVCGPGSIAQAHKPDEFVSEEQLARCDAFMDRLAAELSS